MRSYTTILLISALILAACPKDDPAEQGGDGQQCFPDSTCTGTLECDMGICVEPRGGLGERCIPYNTCDSGLECVEDICRLPGPDCGNELIETGEVCDGSDLDDETCQGFGFDYGDLACRSDCLGFDLAVCSNDASCTDESVFPDEIVPGTTDPMGGVFTLAQALEGLPPGPGPLRAVIQTEHGTLTCALRPDKAPNAVANFVGLARGRRPWRVPSTSEWVKRPFYDGLLFHRVIPAFMAQGGDPLGTGYGGPGYKLDDEISDLSHVPGTLAYANSGPNSNGSQFYITEVATSHLDGGYTIFGLCDPVSVVVALTGVATDANDKPLTDIHQQTVRITRCAP